MNRAGMITAFILCAPMLGCAPATHTRNKVHHVETWVTQRERWRLTPDGWKLAKVDDIRDQKRLVDGQPG